MISNPNPKVDLYLLDGCGRCKHYQTPQCKVHRWAEVLEKLRVILLNTPLKEELKWSQPCYTYEGKNILILSAFKEYCALNFVKGGYLNDPEGLLTRPTEHTHETRQFRFTDPNQVDTLETSIRRFVQGAIDVEKNGVKPIPKAKKEIEFPEELESVFENDLEYEGAFQALTPGRQRSYLLHFSQAKQSATRHARILKCRDKIFSGKGFNEY